MAYRRALARACRGGSGGAWRGAEALARSARARAQGARAHTSLPTYLIVVGHPRTQTSHFSADRTLINADSTSRASNLHCSNSQFTSRTFVRPLERGAVRFTSLRPFR